MALRPLLQELTVRGIRITGQRRILIEIIQAAGRHLDAATLLELARKRDPAINRATVYRTLDLLKRLRLTGEPDLQPRKAPPGSGQTDPGDRVHLACFECGTIEEFSAPLFEQLKAEIAHRTGFHIRLTRLEAGGRCRRCSAAARTGSKSE